MLADQGQTLSFVACHGRQHLIAVAELQEFEENLLWDVGQLQLD